MISGLRGLAQSFVRGAVAIGRAIETTYATLTDLGLGYVKEQFTYDWNLYDQQKAFVDLAGSIEKSQLIPGAIHGESTQSLTCRFKYDVSATYEDLEGNTLTKYWSVINNERLTQEEILARAERFAEEYPEEGMPFHAPAQLEGIWHRSGAFG